MVMLVLLCLQVLVGNKCDMDEHKRAVPFSRGQALANEFGIKFFETSAKSNINVEEVRGQQRSVVSGLNSLTLARTTAACRIGLAPGCARPLTIC